MFASGLNGSVNRRRDVVALYANGPWSHSVDGVLEQNAIFHLINYAFGWYENNDN